MAIHKLTPREVATAGPGKYENGGGLRLVVAATGSKKWVMRFTLDGKRREMGLGSFPDVGLGEARDNATEYRKQAKGGVDPIEARQTEPGKTPLLPLALLDISAHIAEDGRMPSMPVSG